MINYLVFCKFWSNDTIVLVLVLVQCPHLKHLFTIVLILLPNNEHYDFQLHWPEEESLVREILFRGSRLAKRSRPSLFWTCSDPFVWRCAIMQLNLSTFRGRKRSITPLQGFSSLYLLRWSGHIRILVLTRRRITSKGNIISERQSIALSYSDAYTHYNISIAHIFIFPLKDFSAIHTWTCRERN